jgi:hypothetical protein
MNARAVVPAVSVLKYSVERGVIETEVGSNWNNGGRESRDWKKNK